LGEGAFPRSIEFMADEQLRELARLAEAGDPNAGGRLIHGRVRAGALDWERVRLAAYLGDTSARVALSDDAPALVTDLGSWLGGLVAWGREADLRAAIAAARLVVSEWEDYCSDDRPRQALEAGEAWALDPSQPNTAAVVDAVVAGRDALTDRDDVFEDEEDDTIQEAGRALVRAAEAAMLDTPNASAREVGLTVVRAGLQSEIGPAEVRTAVRTELVPWALGNHDPLRERVDSGRSAVQ
jgi:hypothetical protein